MADALIRFEQVALGYGKKTAIKDLNFSVCKGDFIGIIGANGSGKTTMLKGVLGLIKPQGGRIEKTGGLVYGYVPQSNTIDSIFPFTVFEIVQMALRKKEDRSAIMPVLSHVGIGAYAAIPYRDLSGGLKQRVLIARALVNGPEILVLDEPTNDLDLSSEKAIMDLIKNLHETKKMTIIMVSHLINVVINYVHKIGFIDSDTFQIHPIDVALTGREMWKTYHSRVHIGSVCGRKVIVAGCPHGEEGND